MKDTATRLPRLGGRLAALAVLLTLSLGTTAQTLVKAVGQGKIFVYEKGRKTFLLDRGKVIAEGTPDEVAAAIASAVEDALTPFGVKPTGSSPPKQTGQAISVPLPARTRPRTACPSDGRVRSTARSADRRRSPWLRDSHGRRRRFDRSGDPNRVR